MKIVLFLVLIVAGGGLSAQQKIVVAKEGGMQYTTVQAALNSIPKKNKKPITIYIEKGVYREKLHLDSLQDNVTLEGQDKFNTILIYDDHTGKTAPNGEIINTRTSWSFLIKADNFTARNITFQNDAGFTAGQAVAVESDGDKAIFENCRFIGFQDVLFTNNANSRQYYKNCYIEGTTDFIFGAATVWFEQCHIHSKKNSHVTAASTPKEHKYGYVFNDCILTGDTTLNRVSLGRPWRPYANVAYLHCYIGKHIMPQGWARWNETDYHLTTRYNEYKNYGPGADTGRRENWTRQLTDQEAATYTLKNVMGNWDPLKTKR